MNAISNTTQYEIQEQILKKLEGLSTDQLSYLFVLVDQLKESNSTLVEIRDGLKDSIIYKDRIVEVPVEKIVYKDKIVIVPEDAAKLKVELDQKQREIDEYYKPTISVCDDVITKMQPWWNCVFKNTSEFWDQFRLKKNTSTTLKKGIFESYYLVFDPIDKNHPAK